MLKKLMAAAVLTIGIVPMVGNAHVPPEGCVAGGGYSTGDYKAPEGGGIVGLGDYEVSVTRIVNNAPVTTVYTQADGPKLPGDGTIIADDVVDCTATDGFVAVGDPTP